VIAITGNAEEENAVRAIALWAADFCAKPIDLKHYLNCLRLQAILPDRDILRISPLGTLNSPVHLLFCPYCQFFTKNL
jgi:ActR/RegA family two-component response regulator